MTSRPSHWRPRGAAPIACGLARVAPLLSLAMAMLIWPAPSYALDPHRSLTQYVHRIWQVQQGLPQPTIHSIGQSTDGYLWLGTPTGLVRFDGVRFTSIRDVGGFSLADAWIRDLVADDHQGLWLATDGLGLLHLHDNSITAYTTREGLPSDHLRDLFLDHHGTLWIAANSGLAALVNGKIVRFGRDQGLTLDNIAAICQDRDGSIWVGGDGHAIAVWNGVRFTARTLATLPATAAVRAMICSRNGDLWIGATAGLVRLRDGVERRFTTADGLTDDWVYCLCSGTDNTVYAGTQNGFSRLHNGEIENFRTQDGLSQSTVYTLFHDREGSLWAGTKYGLNQFLDRRIIPFTVTEGLPSNDTGPVYQDAAGNIWAGTLGAGLSRFDGHRFSAMTVKQGLASNTILSLAGDPDGNLWIGTDHGLNRLHKGAVDRTYAASDGLPSNEVRCLMWDSRGALWIGTSAGLCQLRDGKFSVPPGPGGAPWPAVLAMCPCADHSMVISTEGGGLYAYDDGRLHSLSQGRAPTRDIDAFYEDPDGALWMGTRGGGLRMLKGDKTFTYSVKDGLYDDDLFGIVPDAKGDLWMACSKGVFSVRLADLRDFAAGKIKSFASLPFTPTDALRTIECKSGVQPAAWEMRDGEVWFSTIHGLIVIDPAHLHRLLPAVPVVVEDVIVNGKSWRPEQVGRLPPGLSNLEFNYTALSFIVPTRIKFRYRLEGFDKTWIDADKRRAAFYTNLSPGHYRFQVMAQNVDGALTRCAPVALAVAPYVYQTRWFFPLCALILAWLIWLAYRQRVGRIRRQLDAVLTERSRIARELHDTLMQGFSGITMEMQALSKRLAAPSKERASLQEIIRDAGVCLREARQSIAGLRTSRGPGSGLSASIAQAAAQMTEAKDVRLKLKLSDSPRELGAEVEYNLLRIAQEAVTNSVKHSGARNIEIALECTAQQLRLCVKDDGSGMKNENGNGIPPGHYGLIGMKERAAQIGADLRIESEAGRGTIIRVLLPTTGGPAAKGETP